MEKMLAMLPAVCEEAIAFAGKALTTGDIPLVQEVRRNVRSIRWSAASSFCCAGSP